MIVSRGIFSSKMHQKPFGGRALPGPAGELKRSPSPPSRNIGAYTSKGREGEREREGSEGGEWRGVGKGRGGKGEGMREGGKGRGGACPTNQKNVPALLPR